MTLAVDDVRPDEAERVKAFMAQVIVESVTRDEQLVADLRRNVEGNVDWWLLHPHHAVHLNALQGGRLVGVVLVRQFWNLCSLFVAADRQRQGVGRELLEAAASRCRDRSPRNALWLNAAPAAIGFYRRLGFIERPATKALPPGFVPLQRPL